MQVTLSVLSCRWWDIEPMGNYVSGVIAVLQTPFTEDGALDEPSWLTKSIGSTTMASTGSPSGWSRRSSGSQTTSGRTWEKWYAA